MPFDSVNIPESRCTAFLKAARALITPRKRWIVGIRNNYAGRMCAIGALEHVMGQAWREYDDGTTMPVKLLASKSQRPSPDLLNAIAQHNNQLGHKATLKMFDEAITESIERDVRKATNAATKAAKAAATV